MGIGGYRPFIQQAYYIRPFLYLFSGDYFPYYGNKYGRVKRLFPTRVGGRFYASRLFFPFAGPNVSIG